MTEYKVDDTEADDLVLLRGIQAVKDGGGRMQPRPLQPGSHRPSTIRNGGRLKKTKKDVLLVAFRVRLSKQMESDPVR